MRRGAAETGRSIRGSLGFFLFANVLPVTAAVVLAIEYQRGEISFRSLPQEGVGLVFVLAGALVGILALGWGAYPALRWAHGATSVRLKETRARYREAGFFGRVGLVPWLVGLWFVKGFLWSDVVLVGLTIAGLVATEVYSLIALATKLRS